MSDDKMKTIVVVAEEGWKYNGELRPCGSEWDLTADDLKRLQSFIDKGVIEEVIETRAVDEQRRMEIVVTAVEKLWEKIRAEENKRRKSAGTQVHHCYNDDPEYSEKGGYTHFSDYAKDIWLRDTGKHASEKLRKWETSDYVKAATGMGEVVGADGGALVPTAFRQQLLMNALETSIVFQRATFVPMTTNALEVPAVDVTSHASNFFGGVVAYWGDEGTAPTASKPALTKVKLSLNSLKALAYVTEELMEDSPISLEGLLPTMFSQAITFQMDQKFLTGTGAGQPLGIVSAPATVSVSKESGQAAATIVANNVINMYSRMYPPSIANAVWIANINTFPQLATLSVAIGTGGSLVGLLSNQQAQQAPVLTLLGRPVIFTEKLPTLGTVGDIIFADFSQYMIGGKSSTGATMQSSMHLKFDQFETAFRIMQRMDGQPWWRSALTPRVATTTLSPFVTLATRA